MQFEFETKQLSYWKRSFCQTAVQEQTQEVIVPDSFPDAARIVYCTALPLLRSKEIRDGSAILSGGIRAACLYVPEGEEKTRSIDIYFPFSMRIDEPSLAQEMKTILDLRVRSADARLVNSRKIMIRIGLGCRMTGYLDTVETYESLSNAPEQVQIHTQTYRMVLPASIEEKTFSFSEEAALPAGMPPIGSIVGYRIEPVITEQKIVGSRVAFKGNTVLKLLYLSDNSTPEAFSQSFPFSQYCELGGDLSEQACDVQLILTGAELELQGSDDENQLLLQIDLLAQCIAYASTEVTVQDDAYAVCGTLDVNWQDFSVVTQLDRQSIMETMRGTIDADAKTITTTAVYPDFPVIQRERESAAVQFPAAVNLLYVDADGKLQGKTGKMQTETTVALYKTCQCDAKAGLMPDGYVSPTDQGAELRFDAKIEILCHADQPLKTIKSAEYEKGTAKHRGRPAIVLRRAASNTSLWEIAKQYRTGVKEISEANGLDSAEVMTGTMLLIPM